MDKKISYLNRTFNDYKEALIEMSERYYPELHSSLRDASVGEWMVDLTADVADNLSYHIDRVYQETNIDSAHELASLYSIARNSGVKIPGPKGAMAEVKISLTLSNEDFSNDRAPIIKRGTRFSSASQSFELLTDVDFNEQFDENGASDRTVIPSVNTNGILTGYTVSKLAVVVAGETRVYRQTIKTSDVKPFMEILLPVNNIMNIESILVVDGANVTEMPSYGAFYSNGCEGTKRFYEVDNLAQNYCWTEKTDDSGIAVKYKYTNEKGILSYNITRGEWKPVPYKFITEYTDKGYLKVIFGAGNGENADLNGAFNKWQMSRILNNNNLGELPKANSTMFILYRVGGGSASNVAKGAINRISYLNADFRNSSTVESIAKSITVTNTTPSISGKDMPSEKEIKYLIKYHNAAQERCVTVKDYIDRLLLLPPKYGTPFRVGVCEENNKIMIYLLGIDSEGHLTNSLPVTLINNIEDYISAYRMINDFVEIKAGKIINLSFEVDVIVDKNYNKSDVVSAIITKIRDYMDINNHLMGEEIYVGDLEKEIGNIDGVVNLINLTIYNNIGGNYSNTQVSQPTGYPVDDVNKLPIDLEASDWILYNDGDSMMEIKNPNEDIRIRVKER
jgi:hypothetical protein